MGVRVNIEPVRRALKQKLGDACSTVMWTQLRNGNVAIDVRLNREDGTLVFVDHVLRQDDTHDSVVAAIVKKARKKLDA